jgi:hypothetical protein
MFARTSHVDKTTIDNVAAVLALAPWAALKQMQLSSFVGIIVIGLEHAPFVFSSFEHAKNLLIMGPNNTKNSS